VAAADSGHDSAVVETMAVMSSNSPLELYLELSKDA